MSSVLTADADVVTVLAEHNLAALLRGPSVVDETTRRDDGIPPTADDTWYERLGDWFRACIRLWGDTTLPWFLDETLDVIEAHVQSLEDVSAGPDAVGGGIGPAPDAAAAASLHFGTSRSHALSNSSLSGPSPRGGSLTRSSTASSVGADIPTFAACEGDLRLVGVALRVLEAIVEEQPTAHVLAATHDNLLMRMTTLISMPLDDGAAGLDAGDFAVVCEAGLRVLEAVLTSGNADLWSDQCAVVAADGLKALAVHDSIFVRERAQRVIATVVVSSAAGCKPLLDWLVASLSAGTLFGDDEDAGDVQSTISALRALRIAIQLDIASVNALTAPPLGPIVQTLMRDAGPAIGGEAVDLLIHALQSAPTAAAALFGHEPAAFLGSVLRLLTSPAEHAYRRVFGFRILVNWLAIDRSGWAGVSDWLSFLAYYACLLLGKHSPVPSDVVLERVAAVVVPAVRQPVLDMLKPFADNADMDAPTVCQCLAALVAPDSPAFAILGHGLAAQRTVAQRTGPELWTDLCVHLVRADSLALFGGMRVQIGSRVLAVLHAIANLGTATDIGLGNYQSVLGKRSSRSRFDELLDGVQGMDETKLVAAGLKCVTRFASRIDLASHAGAAPQPGTPCLSKDSVSRLGDLIDRNLNAAEWEVRDSSVEAVQQLLLDSGRLAKDLVALRDLLGAVVQRLRDDEAYVRASALRLLGACMSHGGQAWDLVHSAILSRPEDSKSASTATDVLLASMAKDDEESVRLAFVQMILAALSCALPAAVVVAWLTERQVRGDVDLKPLFTDADLEVRAGMLRLVVGLNMRSDSAELMRELDCFNYVKQGWDDVNSLVRRESVRATHALASGSGAIILSPEDQERFDLVESERGVVADADEANSSALARQRISSGGAADVDFFQPTNGQSADCY